MAASASSKVAVGAGLVALSGGTAFLSAQSSSAARRNLRVQSTGIQQAEHVAVQAVSSTTALGSVAAAAVVAGAVASGRSVFAHATSRQHLVATRAFENELGVQAPLGFWDPVGYTADGDVVAFQRRRSTELKHGRIAMLAAMGYITPELTGKFPGYLAPSSGIAFQDVPNGLAAISKVPAAGWAQILAYMSFCEISRGPGYDIKIGRPGDFGFYVLTSSDPEAKTKKLNAEIANGRLAMMAIIGMFFQDGLTGSAWGDWATYTDSPLRAFESELGVQAPVGFWDPAGFSKDGNENNFKRRRQTELKHGRIAMLATMGYITPEFSKWPGYLSPTLGIKFEDVPNGLAAISKVPAAGWAQMILWGAYCETSQDQSPGTPQATGDFGWKVLTASDPAEKTKKLAAEIANGRLAMMAIIGMFFQDGLTGSAWGDWAAYTDSPLR